MQEVTPAVIDAGDVLRRRRLRCWRRRIIRAYDAAQLDTDPLNPFTRRLKLIWDSTCSGVALRTFCPPVESSDVRRQDEVKRKFERGHYETSDFEQMGCKEH
jgi:hypothetical protein